MTNMQTPIRSKGSLIPRLITAGVLIPLVLFALFTLPRMSFGIVTGFVFLAVMSEWPRLMGKNDFFQSLVFMCGYVVFILFAIFLTQLTGQHGWLTFLIMSLGLLMWIGCYYIVSYYQQNEILLVKSNFWIGLLGFLILTFCWLGMNIIRNLNYGAYFILLLFLLIWGVDTVAYFAGKKWGKNKLVPKVSPNKTIEGAKAGLIFSVILGCIAAVSFPLSFFQRICLIPLCLLVAIFSIIGDLLISVFKRHWNLKDTGVLLPGHGGLLDRLDSLLAGAPIFALGLLLIGLQ